MDRISFFMEFKIIVFQPNLQETTSNFLLETSYRSIFLMYATTTHAFPWFYAIQFLLRRHFVDSSRHIFFFMANWRRSWWDQSLEACLECHYDDFWQSQVHNALWHRSVSICGRSMVVHGGEWETRLKSKLYKQLYNTFAINRWMHKYTHIRCHADDARRNMAWEMCIHSSLIMVFLNQLFWHVWVSNRRNTNQCITPLVLWFMFFPYAFSILLVVCLVRNRSPWFISGFKVYQN